MTDGVKIIAVLSMIAIITFMIKGFGGGFGYILGAVVLILTAMYFVGNVSQVIEYVLTVDNTASSAVKIAVKALGIAYLTEFVTSICKDVGENGIAFGVQTVGKTEILILGFPLFKELVDICTKLAD